eukprot:3936581-Rhodomonas_salina.1
MKVAQGRLHKWFTTTQIIKTADCCRRHGTELSDCLGQLLPGRQPHENAVLVIRNPKPDYPGRTNPLKTLENSFNPAKSPYDFRYQILLEIVPSVDSVCAASE